MDPESRSIQLEFPHYCTVLLESLNKHRQEGKFCDIAVHVQGRIFQAHKSVLAASSPYFHDKLLLNDASCIVLPSVIEPDTFENLLQLIYSGRLKVQLEALPSHLLVASGLQMWQVVDRCLEILKERSPYRPWSSRASESQSPSSSNYFGQRDEGDSGATETICRKDGSGSSSSELSVHPSVEECPEDDVIKIQVSHKEEEEEDEDEDRVQICSGSVDKSVKIILEETEDSNLASTSYKSLSLPFEGGEQECFSTRDTKIFYIKQERFEQDEGLSTPIHDPHFMKSLTQGRSLGVAEVQALYQAEYQQSGEVSYIIPAPADGFTGKIQPLPDEGVFPQVISKPVDLHGNEIVSHSVHGQVVHAPVKIMAAPDGKKFGCLCGKRFAVKPKRDRHIMLTFSLRPFGCSVCNKKFKLKHHLTEHMKTHDGTLYSCDDCGRKFRVQNCFLKHKELCKGQGWATACWTYK